METLTVKERLTRIERELPEAERLAQAEEAYLTQHADGGPWSGASEKRDALVAEANDLRLQMRGQELSSALDELRNLEHEQSNAAERRIRADEAVRRLAEDETVKRYLAARPLAMRLGWGWSWDQYSAWLESGRARYNAAPQCLLFFESAECVPELRFDHVQERERIRQYREAVGAAEVALLVWSNDADRRQRLLQEHPELKAAS
jgi:hypothetical protein